MYPFLVESAFLTKAQQKYTQLTTCPWHMYTVLLLIALQELGTILWQHSLSFRQLGLLSLVSRLWPDQNRKFLDHSYY